MPDADRTQHTRNQQAPKFPIDLGGVADTARLTELSFSPELMQQDVHVQMGIPLRQIAPIPAEPWPAIPALPHEAVPVSAFSQLQQAMSECPPGASVTPTSERPAPIKSFHASSDLTELTVYTHGPGHVDLVLPDGTTRRVVATVTERGTPYERWAATHRAEQEGYVRVGPEMQPVYVRPVAPLGAAAVAPPAAPVVQVTRAPEAAPAPQAVPPRPADIKSFYTSSNRDELTVYTYGPGYVDIVLPDGSSRRLVATVAEQGTAHERWSATYRAEQDGYVRIGPDGQPAYMRPSGATTPAGLRPPAAAPVSTRTGTAVGENVSGEPIDAQGYLADSDRIDNPYSMDPERLQAVGFMRRNEVTGERVWYFRPGMRGNLAAQDASIGRRRQQREQDIAAEAERRRQRAMDPGQYGVSAAQWAAMSSAERVRLATEHPNPDARHYFTLILHPDDVLDYSNITPERWEQMSPAERWGVVFSHPNPLVRSYWRRRITAADQQWFQEENEWYLEWFAEPLYWLPGTGGFGAFRGLAYLARGIYQLRFGLAIMRRLGWRAIWNMARIRGVLRLIGDPRELSHWLLVARWHRWVAALWGRGLFGRLLARWTTRLGWRRILSWIFNNPLNLRPLRPFLHELTDAVARAMRAGWASPARLHLLRLMLRRMGPLARWWLGTPDWARYLIMALFHGGSAFGIRWFLDKLYEIFGETAEFGDLEEAITPQTGDADNPTPQMVTRFWEDLLRHYGPRTFTTLLRLFMRAPIVGTPMPAPFAPAAAQDDPWRFWGMIDPSGTRLLPYHPR